MDPKHEPVGSRVCGFVTFGYAVSYVSVLPLHMCNWTCLFQLGKVVIDFKQALQIMENYENLKLFEILWRYAIVSGDRASKTGH